MGGNQPLRCEWQGVKFLQCPPGLGVMQGCSSLSPGKFSSSSISHAVKCLCYLELPVVVEVILQPVLERCWSGYRACRVVWKWIVRCLLRLTSQLLKKYHRKQVITSPGENPKQVIYCAFVVEVLEELDRATVACCATDTAGTWLQVCRCWYWCQ